MTASPEPERLTWDEAVAQVCAPGARYAWHTTEVRGVPTRVFDGTPHDLRAVWATARDRGDRTFLVYEDETWTYERFADHVAAVGALLADRYAVARGDRVAIAMRNYPEWIVAFAATTSIGAVVVPLNAWWTAAELAYGLTDAGVRVVLADPERAARLAEAMATGSGDAATAVPDDLHTLVVRLPDGAAGGAAGVALPPGTERYEEVVAPYLAAGAALPEVAIDPDDDATILYTSGTTGHPKGAVSTHRAVCSALMAFGCAAAISAARQLPSERANKPPWPRTYLLCVPLFHVTGCIAVMLNAFTAGSKLVIMYKWDPARALELIERERVTVFIGVPTMSWDLLEHPDFAGRDTSSLVSVGGGGAPAPPELVRRIDTSFRRARPTIAYGMTETNAHGPSNTGDDYVTRPTSSGRCVPVAGIRVTDDAGTPLPAGEVGEIWFQGPHLIRGYWNRPEATAETIVDGWLRSGDLGRLDEDGFIYVEDRVKDMVLRGGENVYCAEVEAAIYEHPGVYEAAVFGVPHERLGEEVAAAVLRRPGAEVDDEALRAHLAARLAPFKIPSRVWWADAQLPRNASGKILKRELRDRYVDEVAGDPAAGLPAGAAS